MANQKTIIHCCVEKDVYDLLIKHCEATGQTKTTAIKRAIRSYCDAAKARLDPKGLYSKPDADPEGDKGDG